MKKTIVSLVLLTVFAADLMAASYTVTIAGDRLRTARVEAQLMPVDGRISLSRNGRDTGLYHGWATFVHEIEAFDSNNESIALEYVPGGHWRLADHAGGPVTVRYIMLLQHDRFPNDPGDDELAWARDWGVMWTGRALFLEGADQGDITVTFDVPADWKVSTPWLRPDRDQWTFVAPDYDALLDSAFVAGTHEEIIIGDVDSPQAILALGGGAASTAELVNGLVEQGLVGFTGLFGATPSKQLLLIAVDGSFWGGGVMGNTISLMQGGSLDENTTPMLAYIVTHEMFHLWNSNFNVASVEDADALQWFGEGAAEYYTWLTAVRSGQVSVESFLGELASRHEAYLAGRWDRSMSATGSVKLDHYDLIYSGGMMATAALDLQIRAATGGEKSLDDALRLLQVRYPADSEQPLRARDLPVLIGEATGVDVASIFESYIFGNEPLPMNEYFALAGLVLADGAVTIAPSRSAQQVQVWNQLTEPE